MHLLAAQWGDVPLLPVLLRNLPVWESNLLAIVARISLCQHLHCRAEPSTRKQAKIFSEGRQLVVRHYEGIYVADVNWNVIVQRACHHSLGRPDAWRFVRYRQQQTHVEKW